MAARQGGRLNLTDSHKSTRGILAPDCGTPAAQDLVTSYLEWNDRIFERFFPVSDQNCARILAFDSSALRAVSEEMRSDPQDFIACVRGLTRPASADPFEWWRLDNRGSMITREPPYYIALLACFSLAASESGGVIEGEGEAFFHRHLARLFDLGDIKYVQGFAAATGLYDHLARYLNHDCGGSRGHLLLANAFKGGKFVGRARFQVLLSESSRKQLHSLFTHRLSSYGELQRNDLNKLLLRELELPDDYVLPPVLRRTLELAHESGAEIFDAFVDLVETEYVRWFLEKPAVRVSEPRGSTLTIGTREETGARRPRQNRIVEEVSQLLGHLPRPTLRTRPEARLVLFSSFGNQPWHLGMQLQSDAGWKNADKVEVEPSSGIVSCQADCGRLACVIDDTMYFANDGNAWVLVNALHSGDNFAIFCGDAYVDRYYADVQPVCLRPPIIATCAEVPEARLIIGDLARIERGAVPAVLRPVLSPERARLSLRNGLRRGGDYFTTCPPHVYFDHATITCAAISVDGVDVNPHAMRRTEYPLPWTLATGSHVVSVLGIDKTFRLIGEVVSSDRDPQDCAGFEVCRARGVAIPAATPGRSAISVYGYSNVAIVVGGLIT